MKNAILALSLLLLSLSPAGAQTSDDKVSVVEATRKVVPPEAKVSSPRFSAGFARTRVVLAGADSATVYLKGGHGHWHVIAGPGTAWSPTELNRLGIPRALR